MNQFRKYARFIVLSILFGMLIISFGLWGVGDMLKAVGHEMALGPVRLLHKSGGRRGSITWPWPDSPWQE